MTEKIPAHRSGGLPAVACKSVTMEELVRDPDAMYRTEPVVVEPAKPQKPEGTAAAKGGKDKTD